MILIRLLVELPLRALLFVFDLLLSMLPPLGFAVLAGLTIFAVVRMIVTLGRLFARLVLPWLLPALGCALIGMAAAHLVRPAETLPGVGTAAIVGGLALALWVAVANGRVLD